MNEIVKSQIRIPKKLYEQAKKVAFDNRISLNQLIVDSLRSHLMRRAYSPTKVKEALKLIEFALEQNNHEQFNTKL